MLASFSTALRIQQKQARLCKPQNLPVFQKRWSSKSSKAAALFPKFMSKYADKVKKAPTTHVVAFLALHELSALVPLAVFWGGFYYFDYLPLVPGSVVDQGSEFIKKICERYTWMPEADPRFIAQGAVAYALVKLLIPLRLFVSFAAAPWLAHKCIAIYRVFRPVKNS